jgi:hypothetical protein
MSAGGAADAQLPRREAGRHLFDGAHDDLAALDCGDKFDDLAEIEQARSANR